MPLNDSPKQNVLNFLDIKLHRITNLPPSWTSPENGAAPLYSEHPFRYKVEAQGLPQRPSTVSNSPTAPNAIATTPTAAPTTTAGGTPTKTGTAGSVSTGSPSQQQAQQSVSFSDASSSAYLFSNGRILQEIPLYKEFIEKAEIPFEVQEEEIADVPSDPGSAPPPPPGSARVPVDNTIPPDTPTALLFALTPQAEAQELKEEAPVVSKKDAKSKKGAPVVPHNTEPVKPTAPSTEEQPPCVLRIPLTPDVLDCIEKLIEENQPLVFLFSRQLRSNAPPEWEDLHEQKYQARIKISLKALSVPGCTAFDTSVRLEPVEPEVKEEEKGKRKAPQKKSKLNIPGLLTEDVETGDNHPYNVHHTTAIISVTSRHAITRLPQSRPMPKLQPSDMIPKRVRPARRPLEASKQFLKDVSSLAQRIVEEYRDHAKALGMEGEDARNSFLNYLQSSGHALAYQQQLVPTVQAVVKERFVKKVAPTKAEMELIVNELYTFLVDQLHVAMDKTFGKAAGASTTAALDGDDDGRWRRLAQEAELMRDIPMGVRYFQERLGQCQDEDKLPEIWCQYAEFSLRVRDVLRAEQAYRESLATDSTHLGALIGYGLLLLSRNRVKEAEVFLQGAADLDGSILTWGAVALCFDILQLSMSDSKANAEMLRHYQRESKQAVQQAIRCSGSSDMIDAESVYELVGKRLVELRLEDLANVALAKATPPGGSSSFSVDYLYAQLFLQAEQFDEAADILNKQLESGSLHGTQECQARVLLGEVHALADRPVEAEAAFDAALRIDPDCAPAAQLIRLGNIYVGLGRYKDALATFLVAARQWPCGLTWLGVGISYYRLEDLGRAEQALNESNVLNNLNPRTWGYLALLCLRQRREEDAESAYNQAVKQGLSDPDLIAEIGAEYYRVGQLPVAEASFKRALAIHEDPNVRMHLARALGAQKRHVEARAEYQRVAEQGVSEFQRMKAQEQLDQLPTQ